MTAARRRDLSVAEYQAALAALWRGDFAGGDGRGLAPVGGEELRRYRGETGIEHREETAAALAGHLSQHQVRASAAWASAMAAFPGPTVLVVAAHAGAGASTVAVLLGDVAASAGAARLIDCADPTRSGVAAATDAELGTDGTGWRQARRGPLHVDRLVAALAGVEDVVAPRPAAQNAADAVTVVDAAWPAWALLRSAGWVTNLLHTARVVVVCRATVPGVRQLEQLLAALPGPEPALAAVGPGKWPGSVMASCGPLVRAARDARRVVPLPVDRALEATGLTSAPLPKQLASAGRALAAHAFGDPPTAVHRQRWAG
jgi:hypothetical protein